MAHLVADRRDHAQRGATIALVPLKIEYRAQPLAAVPDVQADSPLMLGYAAGG
ncbi:MAG TPA: hypothetical protein VEY94_12475 [Patescibacteria group bacterium]|nr:hypothetical protein [Patescibacteria group bacterium]